MNVLRRVQPESIQMELLDPIADVRKVEFPNGFAPFPVEVDCLAPIGGARSREKAWVKLRQIVSIRPKVVVDDVQDHSDPERVSFIHEAPEIVRLAVEPGWREQLHAIVAPAELPRKIRDR